MLAFLSSQRCPRLPPVGDAVPQIAVGHGHAPGTYFLWGLFMCANGRIDPISCEDQYLVR